MGRDERDALKLYREKRHFDQKPYWDIERARISETREVPVEVVVNGYPAARQNIAADGKIRDIVFDVPIARSSWIALRILPSSHTNPIFVLVRGYRAILLDQHAPAFGMLWKFWLLSAVVFVLGHAWFYKLRKSFADMM